MLSKEPKGQGQTFWQCRGLVLSMVIIECVLTILSIFFLRKMKYYGRCIKCTYIYFQEMRGISLPVLINSIVIWKFLSCYMCINFTPLWFTLVCPLGWKFGKNKLFTYLLIPWIILNFNHLVYINYAAS